MNIHHQDSYEYKKLLTLIDSNLPLISNLYVYGPPKSGKSYLVKSLIKSQQNCLVINLNLNICFDLEKDEKCVYEHLLYKFSSTVENMDDIFINDVDEFINKMKIICDNLNCKTLYIILENTEKLTDHNSKLIHNFQKLNELLDYPKVNIITIIVSQTPYYKIFNDLSSSNVFHQFIPQFTNDEIKMIILKDYNSDEKKSEFAAFVEHMLGGLLTFCNDLIELKYIINSKWKLIESELNTNAVYNFSQLSNMYKPYLRKSLQNIFNRTNFNENDFHLTAPVKCFLCATFIASYNSKKSDRKLFLSNKERMSRSEKHRVQEKTNTLMSGPKAFLLDRAFAIFQALYRPNHWDMRFNSDVLYKLINSHMIIPSNKDPNPLKPKKYICVAPHEYVETVATSIGLNLNSYLTDFLSA